jgi:tripartite motif-containing protein 71
MRASSSSAAVNRKLKRVFGFSIFLFLVVMVGAGAAAAEEGVSGVPHAPTIAETMKSLESGEAEPIEGETKTDLHAAQTMAHQGLERGEALELAEAVFGPEIEGAEGIYQSLEAAHFVSENAAVLPVSALPEAAQQSAGGLQVEHPNLPVLVESDLPLWTEDASGQEEAVNLELGRAEQELQPENPLTEVGIPERLGEGISIPGPEIGITVAGAPEQRTPTNASGEFAFYPEVADDTDLIVTPTPEGVETMTNMRSAQAPTRTTYEISMPEGAELKATPEGGAEVLEGVKESAMIPPPTATDAAGNAVATELIVEGDAITVVTQTNPSTSFPVLVDPEFVTEGWRWTLNHETLGAWHSNASNRSAILPFPYEYWASEYPGLDLSSGFGEYTSNGASANWEYWVPRYREDIADFGPVSGSEIETWVYKFSSEGIQFHEFGDTQNYPALVVGIVNVPFGWQGDGVHYGGEGDMTSWSRPFELTDESVETGDKGADMELFAPEAGYTPRRDTYLADAYVSIVDAKPPTILALTNSERWSNMTAEPIEFQAQDLGLGVADASMSYGGSQLPGAGFSLPCNGLNASPCPRMVTSGTPAHAGIMKSQLSYNPVSLPTGKDTVAVTVGDAMSLYGVPGHTFTQEVRLKIDHAAPEVSLSGALTEQGNLGFRRSSYALRVNAKDGTSAAPQSGIGKVEIKVDGKKVPMAEEAEWEPKCQTQNCPFSGEWTLNSSGYTAGRHEVQVIATDAVGNTTTQKLEIELHPPAPTLAVTGTLTEQAALGTERPSYKLKINASSLAESPTPAAIPTYGSSFGTSGAGKEPLSHPGSMVMSSYGNLVVADSGNNRIDAFGPTGGFVTEFGTQAGPGKLSRPTAVAIDAAGNYWVTDSGDRRVVEFASGTGAYMGEFGGPGTTEGKFAGTGPEAIAIDYHGNIWVADTYGGRLEKFDESGKFIRSVGSKGKGPGQLLQPDGIAIAPGGNVFVTDWENDKVVEYGEGGAFIREFGSQGSEPGQLEEPTGIAIDSRGDVWVSDRHNGRIEEFNQAGEYLGRFGAKGSGPGQFELSYPTGIATDSNGDIWISDFGNNRIEKWTSTGYGSSITPTFLRSFGSEGTTAGHFSAVGAIAIDSKGDPWTIDWNTGLLQKFGPAGEFLGAYAGNGSEPGKLTNPNGLAFSAGHLWVADVGNGRIESFAENGAYASKFGRAGPAQGELNGPWDVAVDANHHVWVPEYSGDRLQEFSETGTLVRTVGGEGSGPGTFLHPSAVAVGPAGRIWVTDSGNNRVEEFSETGAFIREIAGPGSGVGRVLEPVGIYVDPAEHVWVVDTGYDAVTEYTGTGEYLDKFGSQGTGPGNFARPTGIAGDGAGHLWVADSDNHRVDEWAVPTVHSSISTTITVDGRRVEGGETSCVAATCPASTEWTLNSSSFSPGAHTVVVSATDGLGNSVTKTLNVKVGDTTKPGLEVGGELFSAPEGWVQQEEGNYSFNATATDAGFGVTALLFKIDGKLIVSKEQACPTGKCSATISASVNVKELAAGAHKSEVRATDGAGNVSTKEWTINVDPEGHVSVEEARRTIEAVEETSGVEDPGGGTILEPGTGPESTPGLKVTEDGLEATETNVPVTLGMSPSEGVEYEVANELYLSQACFTESETPETGGGEAAELELEHTGTSAGGSPQCSQAGRERLEEEARVEEEEVTEGLKIIGREPITIVPLATSGASGAMTPVEGSAALASNTHDETDSVFRPMLDGGYYFEDIRSGAAPEHYSFEMRIGSEQGLILVNPQEAEVKYNDDGPVAVTITALEAHDAIGTAVPTHLSVTAPDILTLTVEHRSASPVDGSFVYPVVAGAGWEGGFRTFSVELSEPPPPPPLEDGDVSTEEGEGLIHVHVTIRGPQTKDGNGDPEGSFAFHECVAKTSAQETLEDAELIEGGGKAAAGGGDPGDAAADEKWSSLQKNVVRPCVELKEAGSLAAGMMVRGIVHVIPSKWVWVNENQRECKKWGPDQPAMVHCYVSPQKSKEAITVGGNFRMPANLEVEHESNCYTVYGQLGSNGVIEKQLRIISSAGAGPYFEKCQWPSE